MTGTPHVPTAKPPRTWPLWVAAAALAGVGAWLLVPGPTADLAAAPATEPAPNASTSSMSSMSSTDSRLTPGSSVTEAPSGLPETTPTTVSVPAVPSGTSPPASTAGALESSAPTTGGEGSSGDASMTATRFAGLFTTTTENPLGSDDSAVDVWRAQLQPLMTAELADGLRLTDPTQIPAARVHDVQLHVDGETEQQYTARYDTGLQLRISVLLTADGWRVSAVEPA